MQKIKIPTTYEDSDPKEIYMNKDEFVEMKRQIIKTNKMLEDAIQFNCWSEPVIATSKNIGYRERWRPIDQFPVSDSKLVKTAILINIQEIKPKTKGERAIELLRKIVENHEDEPHITNLWDGDFKEAKAILEECE